MSYLLGIRRHRSRFGHLHDPPGYLIVCELVRIALRDPTYPRLVRLNPNVPFKTRGNAAVCVEFEAGSDHLRDVAFKAAERLLEAEADVANGRTQRSSWHRRMPATTLESSERCTSGPSTASSATVASSAAISKMGIRHRLLETGWEPSARPRASDSRAPSMDHTYE